MTCRRLVKIIFFNTLLSLSFAQESIPYGKIVRDSLYWKCCFTKEPTLVPYLQDIDPWELSDYKAESRICCFADPAMRRFQIMVSNLKISIEEGRRQHFAKCNEELPRKLDSLKKIYSPFTTKKSCDKPKQKYICYPAEDCQEICSHVYVCE